jgi:flagellar assembly factor FliW
MSTLEWNTMARVLDKRVVDRGLDVACEAPAEVGATAPGVTAEISARRFETTRFGVIDVDLDLVISFADGIIGFESCTQYVVVRHDDASAFRWLQSLDEAAIAFPIVEPSTFRPDYAPTISDTDARTLNLRQDTPTLLFVIVSVPGQNPRAMTANLLAPLVVNGDTRQGKQVIVQDEGYGTRHEVVKELQRAATLGESSVAVTPIEASSPASTAEPAGVRAA